MSKISQEQKPKWTNLENNNIAANDIQKESDILENELGEIDLFDADTSNINEIKKIANSVFLENADVNDTLKVVNEIEKLEQIEKESFIKDAKSDQKSLKTNNSKKIKNVSKKDKKSKLNINKKSKQRQNISQKHKLNQIKSESIEDININKKNDNQDKYEKIITYSKFNPVIKSFKLETSKRNLLFCYFFKYVTLLLALTFSIVALYFSSIWQANNGIGFLVNAGIIKNDVFNFYTLTINGIQYSIANALTESINLNLLNSYVKIFSSLNLYDLSSFTRIESYMMISFSILTIIVSLFSLIFKNGTIWSISLSSFSLTTTIVVIAIWINGMIAQNTLITPFNTINDLFSTWSPTGAPNIKSEIDLKINAQLFNLINLLK